jgi:hypothetical protein
VAGSAALRPQPGHGLLYLRCPGHCQSNLAGCVAQARPDPREILAPHPPQEAPDLDELAHTALVHQALHRLAASLPHRLRYVIVAHYGLDGQPPQTLATIGRDLGFTRQRAQQLHTKALLWLAHPARSLALRRLLECNTVADYQAYLASLRRWRRARRR